MNTRYYIYREQETSINCGDVHNVYCERKVFRCLGRPLRIFIGTGDEFEKVATFVENLSPSRIVVEDHTDGDAAVHMKLSRSRTRSVRAYLNQSYKIISDGTIEAKGYGEDRPIAKTTCARIKLNRRIEVILWE